jgi:N-acetylmuramoyl-L-alanine amidase
LSFLGSSLARTRFIRSRRRLFIIAIGFGLILWLWPARPLRSDNFVFYLPNAREVVPLQTLDGIRYVPLVKVLNLVGTVSGLEEKRHTLRVWVGSDQLELHEGEKKLRVDKQNLEIANPVRLSDGQWVVPLDFLYAVLPRLTRQPLQYRAGDQRMFIGDVRPLTFSASVSPVSNGARLTVQFTNPVTVQTASTNGQWVIFLGDKAVQPLESRFHFDSHYVSGMTFDDQDGIAKLIITPGSAGLNFYPSVSSDGRVFQADVLEPAPQQAQATAPQGSKSAAATPGAVSPPQPGTLAGGPRQPGQPGAPAGAAPAAMPPPPPLPVVVLDAGHGGPDTGAHSRDGVTERDLVAGVVDRVRASLAQTNKFRVVLTRTGTGDPTPDEREVMANLARPVAFLSFHAGDLGDVSPIAAVYTYQAPSEPAAAASPGALLVPWDEAQQAHLGQSRNLAGLLIQQLAKVQSLATRNPDEAPVRQLRSIDAPAVAIELGTLAPRQDAGPLTSGAFDDQVASAVARALAAFTPGAP